jgi:hypothetical protein
MGLIRPVIGLFRTVISDAMPEVFLVEWSRRDGYEVRACSHRVTSAMWQG